MSYLRDCIALELEKERQYQKQKWGNNVDDTVNTPWVWTAYIAQYASKWMSGSFTLKTEQVDDFRAKMLKTAALAIAAVESVDRQRAEFGKTFYEENK